MGERVLGGAGRGGGGLADRGGLGAGAGRVGRLRRWIKRRHRGGGRRRARIAIHRARILGPHLGVERLGGRDRRGVLPQNVGGHQRRQQRPIGRDHRRRHRGRKRRLVGRDRRPHLAGGLLGLGGGGTHPCHIRGGRGRHRHRGGTHPRSA